jgi:hypothetical protein
MDTADGRYLSRAQRLYTPNALLLHYISNTLSHYLVSNDQTLIVLIKKK